MSESAPRYVTCRCQHCDGAIEFDENQLAEDGSIVPCPHCGLETKLSAPAAVSKVLSPIAQEHLPGIGPPLPAPTVAKQKRVYQLAKLTEATIRSTTKSGDTPLHRAAKNGKIHEIPSHLLDLGLFLARNTGGETPLHFAAKHGHLKQVPAEFLTRETVTALDYYGRTPLHVAADYGHADQIPREFLTPEFLSIPTKNSTSNTVLHIVAERNELAKLPSDCVTPEMWKVKNGSGRTPRDVLEARIEREAYVAGVRNEPATEKQKGKLRFFGYTWAEGVTKGQASDALDECVRKFPDIERAYQNRPATKEQREKLLSYGKNPDKYADEPLTYEQANEWILDCRHDEEEKSLDDSDAEYLIDAARGSGHYPGLTRKRVRNAVKALDESRPGWREDKNHIDIMLAKVAELNPELLERWKKRNAPKRRAGKRSRKGDVSGIIILAVILWIIFKAILKASNPSSNVTQNDVISQPAALPGIDPIQQAREAAVLAERTAEAQKRKAEGATATFKFNHDQALSGNLGCMYRLAQLYIEGIGCDKDTTAAIAWLRAAVSAGHPDAPELLSRLQGDTNAAPPASEPAPP
jgi:hypothetical protein